MFWRKPKKAVVVESGNPNDGWFHMLWSRQAMPDPGAQNYAFESLGLVGFTPIGPSVSTREPFQPILSAPQPYAGKAVVLNGMPTVSGQIMFAPLNDPNAGYTSEIQPLGNLPYNRHMPTPAGEII
jgi:hypothetical protein